MIPKECLRLKELACHMKTQSEDCDYQITLVDNTPTCKFTFSVVF